MSESGDDTEIGSAESPSADWTAEESVRPQEQPPPDPEEELEFAAPARENVWRVRVLACRNPDRLSIGGGTLWGRITSLYSKRIFYGARGVVTETNSFSLPIEARSALRIPAESAFGGGQTADIAEFMDFVRGVLQSGTGAEDRVKRGLRTAVESVGWNPNFELLLRVPMWRWLDSAAEPSSDGQGRDLPPGYSVFPEPGPESPPCARFAWDVVSSNSVPEDLRRFWEVSDAVMRGGALGMLVDTRLFGTNAGSVVVQACQRWALAGSYVRAVALTMSPIELMYLLGGVELSSVRPAMLLLGTATFRDVRAAVLEQLSFWGPDWICGRLFADDIPGGEIPLESLIRVSPLEEAYATPYSGDIISGAVSVEDNSEENRRVVEFFTETAIFDGRGYRLRSPAEMGWKGEAQTDGPRMDISFLWRARFQDKTGAVRMAALGAYVAASRFVRILRRVVPYSDIAEALAGNAGPSVAAHLEALGINGKNAQERVVRWNRYAPFLRSVFGGGCAERAIYLDRGATELGPQTARAYAYLAEGNKTGVGGICGPRKPAVSLDVYVSAASATSPDLLDESNTVVFEGGVWIRMGSGYDRLVDSAYWVEQREETQKVYSGSAEVHEFRLLAVTRSDGEVVRKEILREKAGEDIAEYFRRGRVGQRELDCAQKISQAGWIETGSSKSGLRRERLGLAVLPVEQAGRFVGHDVILETSEGKWFRPSLALVRLLCDKKTALLHKMGSGSVMALRVLPDYDPATGGLVGSGAEHVALVKFGLAVRDPVDQHTTVLVHDHMDEIERRRMLIRDVGTEKERVDMLLSEKASSTDLRGYMLAELSVSVRAWELRTGLVAVVSAEDVVSSLWDASPASESVGSLADRFARSFVLLDQKNPIGKHARYYRYMLFGGFLDPQDYFVRDAYPRTLFPELFSSESEMAPLYVFSSFRDRWCSAFVRYMVGKMLFSWNFHIRELKNMKEEMASLATSKLQYVHRTLGMRNRAESIFDDSMEGAIVNKQDEEEFAGFADRVMKNTRARFYFYEEDGAYYAFSWEMLEKTGFTNPATKKRLRGDFVDFVRRSQNSKGAQKLRERADSQKSARAAASGKLGGYKKIMVELLGMRTARDAHAPSDSDICNLCSVAFGADETASGLARIRRSPLLRLKGDMARYCSEKCRTEREYGSYIGELVGFVSARRIMAISKLERSREAADSVKEALWERQEEESGPANAEIVAGLVSELRDLHDAQELVVDSPEDLERAGRYAASGELIPPSRRSGNKKKNRQEALSEAFDRNLVRFGLEEKQKQRLELDRRIRHAEEKLARTEQIMIREEKKVQCGACRADVEADMAMKTVIAGTGEKVVVCSAECAADIMSPADETDSEEEGPSPGPRHD